MSNKRKQEIADSLSSALEPPRRRQQPDRLNDLLQDYSDPRDFPAPEQVPANPTPVQYARVVPETTLADQSTLIPETTLVQQTTVAPYQGDPWHDATVAPQASPAPQTTPAPYAMVETEYTKTPNDLWDEVMPTLDPYDQSVLWQLYRLSRGFHRSTCTVGYPKLAKRCNISAKQTQLSVGRLEKRGLIKRLGSDFGNADISQRGNIYEVNLPEGREAQRTRVASGTRVAPPATLVPDAHMKENIQSESTQTQPGVSVASRFTLEECRRYADHLFKTGQGITKPGGYATTIYRSGEADTLIDAFLNPSAPLDASQCPDCQGRGFAYLDDADRDLGVKPCKHPRLR